MAIQARELRPDPADATSVPQRDDPHGQGTIAAAWPWAAVAVAVTWSLWELRATLLPAQFLNDSSLHEQMVRFAAARIGGRA